MLRRFSLAVFGFALSSSVCAGGMGPVCLPGSVTVPCVENYWEFGAQALYLTSSFTTPNAFTLDGLFAGPRLVPNKSYAVAPPVLTSIVDPFINPGNPWSWGYFLQGAYHFNTGNDITLSWLHYQASVTDNWSTVVDIRRELRTAPLPTLTTDFIFSGLNRFDQVNIEMGQVANFDLGKQLRFFGGLQLAHIQADAETCFTFSGFVPVSPIIPGGFYNDSDFKGIGAVVGIDYFYYLTQNLSLTANGSGSLLIGTNNYNAAVVDSSSSIVLLGGGSSDNYIVPTLQGSFGASYAIPTSQGLFHLQVGYLALNYFNVIQSQPFGLGGSIARSDYGLVGPYAGLNYVGNA